MVKTKIDINADVGEGTGNDHLLMPFISSCSIACGGHYGDDNSMRETIRLAKIHSVKIGAHPSFPDRFNFGRKIMKMGKKELASTVCEQVLGLYNICREERAEMHHIKLHGALYNLASTDRETAEAVLRGIEDTKLKTKLMLPYISVLSEKAKQYYPLVFEAFIDRRYREDLTLLPRGQAGAVITEPEVAWLQLYEMVFEERVTTENNEKQNIVASTFCIHGDNLNALQILKYIHRQMESHGITLDKNHA